MEVVKNRFEEVLKSTGVPPTGVELLSFARKKKDCLG